MAKALRKDLAFHNVVAKEKEKLFNVREKIMIIEIIKAGKLPGVRVEDFRQSVYPAIHAEAQDWQQTKEEEDQLNELERSLEQYKSDDWKDDETMQRWVRRSKVMLEVQRDYVRHSFRYLQMLRA